MNSEHPRAEETDPADPTPSLVEGILRRASALRRRYLNVGDAPQDTWSLVNRVAADKFAGELSPAASGRDHLYGLWTKAMVSVLNDLHRRQRTRERRSRCETLDEAAPAVEAEPDEALHLLDAALAELARRDERLGEQKALLVALKYFEGLTWEQLASTLGSSVHRVRDEWSVTQAWLRRDLKRRGVDLG